MNEHRSVIKFFHQAWQIAENFLTLLDYDFISVE